MQDPGFGSATNASEGSLEALLARMHSASGAANSPPTSSQGLPSHQPGPNPSAVAASDLGRVMQWAGTELLLRDQKVPPASKSNYVVACGYFSVGRMTVRICKNALLPVTHAHHFMTFRSAFLTCTFAPPKVKLGSRPFTSYTYQLEHCFQEVTQSRFNCESTQTNCLGPTMKLPTVLAGQGDPAPED